MKNIFTISLLCFLTASFSADAQVIFGRQPITPSPKVATDTEVAPETKAEKQAVPTEVTEPKEEIQGIPVKLSEEDKEAADDALRDNLRDTTKQDDLKARVNFLEANDYQDKVMLRRKLMENGESFRVSSYAADSQKKASVNPQNDAQMNEYIFERSGVAEHPKADHEQ